MKNPTLITIAKVLDLVVINGSGQIVEACGPSSTDAWFILWVEEMKMAKYVKYRNMLIAYNGKIYRQLRFESGILSVYPYSNLSDDEFAKLVSDSYVLPGVCTFNDRSKTVVDDAIEKFLVR